MIPKVLDANLGRAPDWYEHDDDDDDDDASPVLRGVLLIITGRSGTSFFVGGGGAVVKCSSNGGGVYLVSSFAFCRPFFVFSTRPLFLFSINFLFSFFLFFSFLLLTRPKRVVKVVFSLVLKVVRKKSTLVFICVIFFNRKVFLFFF